jgi:taurine dioxygenase
MNAVRKREVVPTGRSLGAEVKGVDVALGVTEEDMACVRDALHRYGVIVLRNQRITPRQQVDFAGRLGKLRVSFMRDLSVEGQPELTVVSNIKHDGKPIGLMDAGALWHSDGSYLPQPDMYTVLHSLQIPKQDGRPLGDTLFLSASAAYDQLPDSLRHRVDGLRAVHSLSHHLEMKQAGGFNVPPVKDAKPDVEHPAVRAHPVSGRKCLFVTEGHTKCIVGMPREESDALLKELCAHLKRPDNVYAHKWQEDDLLVWDNCGTQHLAITDYGDMPRRLHRAGIEGPVPV